MDITKNWRPFTALIKTFLKAHYNSPDKFHYIHHVSNLGNAKSSSDIGGFNYIKDMLIPELV